MPGDLGDLGPVTQAADRRDGRAARCRRRATSGSPSARSPTTDPALLRRRRPRRQAGPAAASAATRPTRATCSPTPAPRSMIRGIYLQPDPPRRSMRTGSGRSAVPALHRRRRPPSSSGWPSRSASTQGPDARRRRRRAGGLRLLAPHPPHARARQLVADLRGKGRSGQPLDRAADAAARPRLDLGRPAARSASRSSAASDLPRIRRGRRRQRRPSGRRLGAGAHAVAPGAGRRRTATTRRLSSSTPSSRSRPPRRQEPVADAFPRHRSSSTTRIEPRFGDSAGPADAPPDVGTSTLPVTTPPAQVPRIVVRRDRAVQVPARRRAIPKTEPRRRFLWLEFDRAGARPERRAISSGCSAMRPTRCSPTIGWKRSCRPRSRRCRSIPS